MQLEKWQPQWSAFHSSSSTLMGPQEMIAEVRQWPHPSVLAKLKECLDFSSSAWVSLYLELGGTELLLDVLLTHLEGLSDGNDEAHTGVVAALECIHSLLSSSAGLEKARCLLPLKVHAPVCGPESKPWHHAGN